MVGDDDLNDRLSEEQIESLNVVWDDPGQFQSFPDASRKASDCLELAEEEAAWEPRTEDLEMSEDPVRMYLREIGATPLLTFKEERELSRKLEGKKHLVALEEEFNEKGGRSPLPWEVTGVLLRRLVDSAPLLAALEEHLGLPHDLTLFQVSSHPKLRAEIDAALSQSMISNLADALEENEEEIYSS